MKQFALTAILFMFLSAGIARADMTAVEFGDPNTINLQFHNAWPEHVVFDGDTAGDFAFEAANLSLRGGISQNQQAQPGLFWELGFCIHAGAFAGWNLCDSFFNLGGTFLPMLGPGDSFSFTSVQDSASWHFSGSFLGSIAEDGAGGGDGTVTLTRLASVPASVPEIPSLLTMSIGLLILNLRSRQHR